MRCLVSRLVVYGQRASSPLLSTCCCFSAVCRCSLPSYDAAAMTRVGVTCGRPWYSSRRSIGKDFFLANEPEPMGGVQRRSGLACTGLPFF